MKKNLIILIILCIHCQTFSQIVKLHKGDSFPFDTGVAFDIDTYRSYKWRSDNFDTILYLKNEKLAQDSTNLDTCDSLVSNQKKKINSLNLSLHRKNDVIDTLLINIDNKQLLMDQMEPKKSWWKRTETLIVAGVSLVIGLIIN